MAQNNSDKPAYPTIESMEMKDGSPESAVPVTADEGLTKREKFASMMMQAYIMNPGSILEPEKEAVNKADKLLAELEKPKKGQQSNV